MRLVLLLVVALLAACQSTKKETDYGTKPKTCDARSVDSGLCVPGEYD
ncbi:hypothetical protein [Mesorhizobium marinum]|uniref:Lipoprotein n=1 Tax=Mesorhizobium marinum TaxID=3228790 RepID=A0ABV3R3V1_9HYPH